MNEERIQEILDHLKHEVQLEHVDYFQNEEDEYVFVTHQCITTFKKNNNIVLDYFINLYPDEASLITLGIYELLTDRDGQLIIGTVFTFDHYGEIFFGKEAVEVESKDLHDFIEDKTSESIKMDNMLLYSQGIEC